MARARSKLDRLTDRLAVRIAIAIVLTCLHLLAFQRAGEDRLGLPFNSAPGEAPYFSDPDAPAIHAYPRQPHHWSRLIVSRLDAQHYISTSVRGLTACPDGPKVPGSVYLDCGLGWLPAWGTVGGLVSDLTKIPNDVTLVLLSMIAGIIINMLWISKSLTTRIGKLEAYAILLAFNLYPSAFYVVTPYTEAATIALVIGGFVALVNERWLLAGLLVGASTALRISAAAFAIGLGCALLVAAWQRRAAGTPKWWRPLLAIPLCGWGQVATMAFLQIFVGDYRAFLRARESFGDHHDWSRLWDIEYYLKGFAAQHADSVILFAMIAIMILTWREVVRRFDRPVATYLVVSSAVTLVLVVVAPMAYWGITRYLLLCPLAFLGMGVMARRHKTLFVGWLIVSALFYWHLELCGYIAQGDSRACPCMGRYEFAMPFES